MSGPFKPEDFEAKIDVRIGFSALINYSFDDLQRLAAAELANIADAKRWICPKGGEHEPTKSELNVSIRDGAAVALIFGSCAKCEGRIEARWELVTDTRPSGGADSGSSG